jgi:hypothetical protein
MDKRNVLFLCKFQGRVNVLLQLLLYKISDLLPAEPIS